MTDITGVANLQEVLQQKQEIINAAQLNAVSNSQFVYLAGFDGTNNTFVPTNGDLQNTNVAQLVTQAQSVGNANIVAKYFAGVGTEGTLTASSWLSPQATAQVILTAQAAYNQWGQTPLIIFK